MRPGYGLRGDGTPVVPPNPAWRLLPEGLEVPHLHWEFIEGYTAGSKGCWAMQYRRCRSTMTPLKAGVSGSVRAYAVPAVYNHREDLPDGVVFVGRPSRWGNPEPLRAERERRANVLRFRDLIADNAAMRGEAMRLLAGKALVCYCFPKRCHADVWWRAANGICEYNFWTEKTPPLR